MSRNAVIREWAIRRIISKIEKEKLEREQKTNREPSGSGK